MAGLISWIRADKQQLRKYDVNLPVPDNQFFDKLDSHVSFSGERREI
jgi:hypothetical protein